MIWETLLFIIVGIFAFILVWLYTQVEKFAEEDTGTAKELGLYEVHDQRPTIAEAIYCPQRQKPILLSVVSRSGCSVVYDRGGCKGCPYEAFASGTGIRD